TAPYPYSSSLSFLCQHASPRPLPSFPTRRSSDLIFVDKAAPPEVKKALRLAGARVFGPGGTFEQDDMDNWQGCTQTAPRAVWVRSEGTRLNSSHLGISYAVFCLKKKKQEMTES